jgi:hypothetical protein
MFSDGMHFAMNYYNSYVIQPYLINIIEVVNARDQSFDRFLTKLKKISERYAELQERSINCDGSFPVIGRSILCRGGPFHHLADIALRRRVASKFTTWTGTGGFIFCDAKNSGCIRYFFRR